MRSSRDKVTPYSSVGPSAARSVITGPHLKMLAKFLLENPNPILCINKKGILLFINRSGRVIFSGKKMVLNRMTDIEWRKLAKNAFRKNKIQQVRRKIKNRTFEFDLFPVKKEGYVNLYGRDITKQSEVEAEASLKAKLLDNGTETVFLHDARGKFFYVNETAYKSRGYTKEEFMKLNLRDVDVPEFAKVILPRIDELKKTGESIFESAQYRKDGSVMPVEVHAKTIHLGKKTYFLAAIRDITERKLAQKKLQETLMESQSRLLVSTLTSGIVHEIRNPLVAIKTFFELWNNEQADEGIKIKFGALALKEVTRIEHLLTGFLAYAKPSARIYHIAKLSGAMNAAVSLGVMEAKKRRIKIVFIPEKKACSVNMDPQQMEGVFLNIIMNAVDSMSAGGRLVISARCDLKRNMIDIIFRDNGCGMPKSVIAQLYNPFFTTKKKGTGLGLMICRRVIMEHGGEMRIKSEQNKGTTVKITLPIAGRK